MENLQEFIEKQCTTACQPVDLLRISRTFSANAAGNAAGVGGGRGRRPGAMLPAAPPRPLQLVVDAESCLDRLYGGFYSDWACGGQWNRMLHFLHNMLQACHAANVQLLVYLNGALQADRLHHWYTEQIEQKKKVAQVLKHINNKGTPPPKVWWIPPVCLRSALRLVLRQYGIPVACSLDDHHQEVITYCRENFFHGIVGQHAVYAIFDPPRYFSAQSLKLTYHNSLETTEYVIDEVARSIDLHPKRFPIVAALLGNHILTEDDLKELHTSICPIPVQGQKNPPVEVITAVIGYVRKLQSIDDLDTVGQEIFKDDRAVKFRQSVQYYINGTHEGFLKYKTRTNNVSSKKQPGSYPSASTKAGQKANKETEEDSEKTEDNIKADSVYTEAESGYSGGNGADSAGEVGELEQKFCESVNITDKEEKIKKNDAPGKTSNNSDCDTNSLRAQLSQRKPMKLPRIPLEIMRIVCERHSKGLMMPWVYQVLTQGELKIDVSLEDDMGNDLPSAVELYRYTRQKVYAILFDLGPKRAIAKQNPGQSGDIMTDVLVREWVIPRGVGGPKKKKVPTATLR